MRKSKWWVRVIGIVLALGLYLFVDDYPVENFFFRFSTVEQVINYAYGTEWEKVDRFDDGDDTLYLFDDFLEQEVKYRKVLLKRDEKGWLVFLPNRISSKGYFMGEIGNADGGVVDIIPLDNDKYYVNVASWEANTRLTVTDQFGTKFTEHVTKGNAIYFAFVHHNLKDDYIIIINGHKYLLGEMEPHAEPVN